MQNIPRLVIGAGQGRSGKTTFTLGLLSALSKMGLDVQPFKKGPDYIDPSWMSFASGNECRNLDLFMMNAKQVRETFVKHSLKHDLSVVEGAMGLYDGLDVDGSNSTAEIAYTIDAPIILVVNCQRITRSVAAIINGITSFDDRLNFGGVILNNVARARHNNIMHASIERYCNIEILGSLPKSKDIEIPDRHLGLIPAGEKDLLKERVDNIANLVSENVNLARIIEIAKGANALDVEIKDKPIVIENKKPTIAVIKDRAFSFYYPENIEALEDCGAKVKIVNSMEDEHLGDVDGIYIGGGFPEVMAKEISANVTLCEDIKKASENNMPIYAECGGLMYLSRSIIVDDEQFKMVGVFDCDVAMQKKPQGHGYAIQEARENQPFFTVGEKIVGHEFHNSKVVNLDIDKTNFAYNTLRGKGIIDGKDGLLYKNTLGCYHHLHASAVNVWASNFVALAKDFCNKKGI